MKSLPRQFAEAIQKNTGKSIEEINVDAQSYIEYHGPMKLTRALRDMLEKVLACGTYAEPEKEEEKRLTPFYGDHF